MKSFFTTVISVVLFTACLFAQEAVITVEALSPDEIHDFGWDSTYTTTTGLNVVGNEERTYLVVSETSGEEISSVTWEVSEKPAGSNATVDSNTTFTTFQSDLTGKYTLQATITTASGTASALQIIYAAEYVGVGDLSSYGDGECAPCHYPLVAKWEQTGHATMFTLAIDGLVSSHYGESCIECHTVGYNEFADNGGFDDAADESGWTFPETLEEGNWENIVNNYPEVAKKSNIQCENCHGAGGIHFADFNGIGASLDEGVCGTCHEEGDHHVKNRQWKTSGHAIGVESASTRTNCNPCHSGWGFVQFATPHNWLDTEIGAPEVSCAVCHDPHSNELPYQIRIMDDVELENGVLITSGNMGKLCMNCHKSRRDADEYVAEYHDHFGPHHSPQTDMLAGTNAYEYGIDLPSTGHDFSVTDACVTCHMSPTPAEGPAANMIGEHTFNMSYEGIDNVSACVNCHGPINSFDDIMANSDYDEDGNLESVGEEVHGLLEKVAKLLPPLNEPEVVVDTTEFPIEVYTPKILRGAYNYFFVEDDMSGGMHNAAYSIELLRVTYADLAGITYVEEYKSNSAPKTFDLSQNYPNPFNPSTTIKYSIPRETNVTIKVYDALGKEVETLVDGFKSTGTYEVTWNANQLASGIYFYRIQTDSFVQTKKMLLIK